jgi:DNA-binding NarL/FixJ family response regulator
MAHPIRVLIVDDRLRSREGLRALLATSHDIQVVAEATNGQEAISLVDQHHPDVVVMDVRMPVMDGLEATRCIKCRYPQIHVILLTLYANYRTRALAAGASAFLIKGAPAEGLIETIKTLGSPSACSEGCIPPHLPLAILHNETQKGR